MSNNLEAIELLKSSIERLKEQGFSTYGNTVSELLEAIQLLQADEPSPSKGLVKLSKELATNCGGFQCEFCSPTKEEGWEIAQRAGKTFDRPTKETKLRELRKDLDQDFDEDKVFDQLAMIELIDILLEEEY